MKKFLAIVICLSIILSASNHVFADENDEYCISEDTIYRDTFIDPALVGSTYQSDIALLDYYGERQVYVGTYTTYKTVYVTPTGQPSLGYVGGTGGYIFFFYEDGSSVKFTVTIDTKYFTFSAETGVVSSSGSGYGAVIPSASGYYRFDFIKNYTITTKRYDVYGSCNEYKYSFYDHDAQYSLSHRWVKVG